MPEKSKVTKKIWCAGVGCKGGKRAQQTRPRANTTYIERREVEERVERQTEKKKNNI
jgi:hypothetical protein